MVQSSNQSQNFINILYNNSNIFGSYANYDIIYEKLYKGIRHVQGGKMDQNDFIQGAIFNLKFSPDGRILIAACENCCLQVYDPRKLSKTHEIIQAHNGCVNCIKFLDSKTFATGSDDKTIRIWDLRRTNEPLHVLKGHKGWVKNIEYDENAGLLVSSSFDQIIRTWDIHNLKDENIESDAVLNQPELIRARLSHDCSKLFLALTDGNGVIVIHDLNLKTILNDLKWGPTLKRNRLEFLIGCPQDMWCVYSIDVHPFDWCIVARFVTKDDESEKLCTFDIQDVHLGGMLLVYLPHFFVHFN